jgi:hypothetical protein
MTRRQRLVLRIALIVAGLLVLGVAAAGYRRTDLMLFYENLILLCS